MTDLLHKFKWHYSIKYKKGNNISYFDVYRKKKNQRFLEIPDDEGTRNQSTHDENAPSAVLYT